MDAASAKALTAFGFLTVLESADHGLFGGYLVLSPQGRPLEFRCSTPVAASRAQEILYGPTLRPYIISEVIGQALVAGAEFGVSVILTDQREMLPLTLMRPEPVVLIEDSSAPADPATTPIEMGETMEPLIIDGCRITTSSDAMKPLAEIAALLEPLAANVYLAEPFQRIRAALTEAQLASHEDAERLDDRAAA